MGFARARDRDFYRLCVCVCFRPARFHPPVIQAGAEAGVVGGKRVLRSVIHPGGGGGRGGGVFFGVVGVCHNGIGGRGNTTVLSQQFYRDNVVV